MTSLHARDAYRTTGSFPDASFWDELYTARIEDASYELEGEGSERRSALQNAYRGMEIASAPMPEITRRLEETVGDVGGGRYEWLQSFTTIRPVIEGHIGPLMSGWVPPARLQGGWEAKMYVDGDEAEGKKGGTEKGEETEERGESEDDEESDGSENSDDNLLSLEDARGDKNEETSDDDENDDETASSKGDNTSDGASKTGQDSTPLPAAEAPAPTPVADTTKTDAVSIAKRTRATARAHIATRAAPIHRVHPSTCVLNVGCGTSTIGEDLFHAGWPNVLNMDFSKVGLDYVRTLWTKQHWEAIQAKIAKDLAEESQAEARMVASWDERRTEMARKAEGFAETETARFHNKVKKRGAQLSEFEAKCATWISEAQSSFQTWKDAQPDGAETSPGVLTPEAQVKERDMKAVVQKHTDKLEALRAKAKRSNAKSKEDLDVAIANHGNVVAKKIEQLEARERREHVAWCQGRRDYMDRGMGLCEGLRHYHGDSTDEAAMKEVFPDETFDLVLDKGTFDAVLTSTAELRQPASDDIPAAHSGMKVDTREAPHPYRYGKHVRNMWRILKQGGVYCVISTGRPETRLQKIKSVGHGLKASFAMWQSSAHFRLEKLGARQRNPYFAEEKYHWCYVFVKTARRDVKRVEMLREPVLTPRSAEEELEEDKDEDEEDGSSSDDSSEGDLFDDEESEEESQVSDVEESQVSPMGEEEEEEAAESDGS